MDYLISPAKKDLNHDRTPWLGFDHDALKDEYFSPEFLSYPFRAAMWSLTEIKDLRAGRPLNNEKAKNALPLVQSWLFFGLLESVLGRPVGTDTFLVSTSNNGGHMVQVDTSCLRLLIGEWHKEFQTSPSDRSESAASSLRMALDLTRDLIFIRPLRWLEQSPQAGLFDSVIRLSVLLGEALGCLFVGSSQTSKVPPRWYYTANGLTELTAKLREKGWCPSACSLLISTCFSVAEYASLMRPISLDQSVHDRCTEEVCVANNVDPDFIRPSHTTPECCCKMLIADVEKIWAILQSEDCFPVLSLDTLLQTQSPNSSKTASSTVTTADAVVPFSPTNHFVAFSHVWSDGLGSCTEIGLPTCQVHHLRELSLQAGKTPLVWIDSLMIPRERKARASAIQKMKLIYSSCRTVVVLDKGLKLCSFVETPTEELNIRLLTCNWMRRLWTLQEAILAPRIHFDYKDVLTVDSHGNEEGILPRNELLPLSPITYEVARKMAFLRHTRFGDRSIGAVQALLSFRTSSRVEDETIAIAPLLGVNNISTLLQVGGQEARMTEFWKLVNKAPKNIILLSGPKLGQPGLRWAPLSLMHINRKGVDLSVVSNADITPVGLLGTYLLLKATTSQDSARKRQKVSKLVLRFMANSQNKEESVSAIANPHMHTTLVSGLQGVDISVDAFALLSHINPTVSVGAGLQFLSTGTKLNDEVLSAKVPIPIYRYVGIFSLGEVGPLKISGDGLTLSNELNIPVMDVEYAEERVLIT